jgi:hypothetical protein
MKHLLFILTSFCLFFSLNRCVGQTPVRELRLEGNRVVLVLDSAAAAQAIVSDRSDRFFERVTLSEMSIQMKRTLTATDTRASLLPAYLAFLKSDVSDFDAQESKFATDAMLKIFNTCKSVSGGIFPDTVRLIKTKGTHYGNSVYYTREKCIVIPANELAARKRDNFTATMFHEVFHIYSRLNPEKRRKLYQLIGFQYIGFEKLILPAELASRVLLNPDGVDFGQKIALHTPEGEAIEAIPIIYAKDYGHQPGRDEFFGYLQFNLFQIKSAAGDKWEVVAKEDGYTSTLKVENLPDFFRQIRDNTGYIIHPDEVLADNFSFIMREKNSPNYTAKFSKAGKQLLEEVEKILKE